MDGVRGARTAASSYDGAGSTEEGRGQDDGEEVRQEDGDEDGDEGPSQEGSATKRTPAKKTAAKALPPTVETVADPATIGVNPQRRYGSADSRALRR